MAESKRLAEARQKILTQHVEGDVGGHGDAQAVVSLAGDDASLILSTHTYTNLGSRARETKG